MGNGKNYANSNKLKRFFTDNIYIFVAMIAVDFIMVFILYIVNVYPFGDNMMLEMDAYHQYWPLLTELFDRITEHKSLTYSWNAGLGGPFLGDFFNYLSSPLSLLILVFGRNHVTEAMAAMIVFKTSLAAGSFALYLKKSQGKSDFITAGFGILYAQCGWFMAYYWNVMWCDALYILPMVALGIEQLIKNKKPLLYIFSLALSLVTNYYMGYMLCIYSVIYFLVYYFSNYRLVSDTGEHIGVLGARRSIFEKIKGSQFINRGVTFAICSLLAACLVAFALVPTFLILRNSSSTSGSFPKELKTYFTFFEYFIGSLAAYKPALRSQYSGSLTLPNIYSGVITLVLVPVYFLSKEIKKREKLCSILTLVFFYFSFNINFLDYVWHAFHFPNDLPYRFSFIYSFLVLIMAYKAFVNIKNRSSKAIAFGVIIAILIGVVSKISSPWEEINSQLVSTFVILGLYLVIIAISRHKNVDKITSALLVFCIVIIEISVCNTGCYAPSLSKKKETDKLNEYYELTENLEDNEFYRLDFDKDAQGKICMRPSLYGYNGISVFTSMKNQNVAKSLSKTGFNGNEVNSVIYNMQNPVSNMMTGLKYMVIGNSDEKIYGDFGAKIKSTENLTLLQNSYYLPLGYTVNSGIKNWTTDSDNPFENLNNWFSLATGEKDVFKKANVTFDDESIIASYEDETYKLNKDKLFDDHYIYINAQEDSPLYVYVKFKGYKHLETSNGNIDKGETYIKYLGKYNSESPAYVELRSWSIESDAEKYEVQIFAYALDENVLNKGYEKLKACPMDITEFNETHLEATVNARENALVWTSIPYDEGWQVKVDGVELDKQDISAVDNTYLCFNVAQGEHRVEFTFTQTGLKEGIIISVATMFILLAYCVIRKSRKKK